MAETDRWIGVGVYVAGYKMGLEDAPLHDVLNSLNSVERDRQLGLCSKWALSGRMCKCRSAGS